MIQEQSGVHVRQIVFPEWLVTAFITLVGLFMLSLIGYSIHKSDELKFVWKSARKSCTMKSPSVMESPK